MTEEEEVAEEAAPLSAIFMPHTGSKFLSFQGSICLFSRSSSARRRDCISGVNSPSWSLSFHSTKALAKNSLFNAVELRRIEEGEVVVVVDDDEDDEEEERRESHSGSSKKSRCWYADGKLCQKRTTTKIESYSYFLQN